MRALNNHAARSQAGAFIGLLLVLSLFCAPLFENLGGWDLRSDEAIYSYAVDRIIETGEWLTPRSIQVDGPFLEKPPLKFWMVAAAIKGGLVPHDEVGYRLLDALMGALAFVYIYFLAWRIAGPVCGVVAVLLTFSIRGIVFDHGLRSNNMEAPLFLAYCAGVYHFVRWVDDDLRPRLHALAVALFFALGFLTKFVAMVFLPLLFVVSVFTTTEVRARLVRRWRDWIPATLLALFVIAPWFIYQTVEFGRSFWEVILGIHVVTRFTSALDPAHLRPWHFYFTQLWRDLARSELALIVAVIGLIVGGWRARPWPMRLALLWFVIPIGAISLGTSKLFHYAYPFFPPLGVGAGFAVASFLEAIRLRSKTVVLPGVGFVSVQLVLVTIAAAAIAVAAITVVFGPVHVRAGGMRVFQNSTVSRPLVVAAVSLALAGHTAKSIHVAAWLALILVLPVTGYHDLVRFTTTRDVRLRTLRDCALEARLRDATAAAGVYNVARGHTHHAHYFYLSKLGPWDEPETADPIEVERRLFTPGRQTLTILTHESYEHLRQRAKSGSIASLPPAVVIDTVVVVTPGAYASCATAAKAAGAESPTPQ